MQSLPIIFHKLCRCDHSLVVGQSSALKLTLRGSHSNRRVACFSSAGPAMKVHVREPHPPRESTYIDLLLLVLAMKAKLWKVLN